MIIRKSDHHSSDQKSGRDHSLHHRKASRISETIPSAQNKNLPFPDRITPSLDTRQAGYSLIEIIATLGIATVLILSIWNVLKIVRAQFYSLQSKIRMEIEANELMFAVQHNLGMGIKVVASDISLNSVPFKDQRGQILSSYNLNNWTATYGSGTVDVIGFFLRDDLSSRTAGKVSINDEERFLPTAFFFQRPTIDKYGVLYVSTETDKKFLKAQNTSSFFEGLVDFKIVEVVTKQYRKRDQDPLENRVHSVTFQITQRHYLPDNIDKPYVWCPPQFMGTPSCPQDHNYTDYVKIFTVKVRNNIIEKSRHQRVAGPIIINKNGSVSGLYPETDRRVFDGIYFLRPTYPAGALTR